MKYCMNCNEAFALTSDHWYVHKSHHYCRIVRKRAYDNSGRSALRKAIDGVVAFFVGLFRTKMRACKHCQDVFPANSDHWYRNPAGALTCRAARRDQAKAFAARKKASAPVPVPKEVKREPRRVKVVPEPKPVEVRTELQEFLRPKGKIAKQHCKHCKASYAKDSDHWHLNRSVEGYYWLMCATRFDELHRLRDEGLKRGLSNEQLRRKLVPTTRR